VIVGLLDRHVAPDWGDLDAEDKATNDAVHSYAEGRLFSSYDTEEHGTIWVITEDLRGEGGGPITTVLVPEDYGSTILDSARPISSRSVAVASPPGSPWPPVARAPFLT